MKLTNYQKGRAKEYRIKKKYEKAGCIVLRTARSIGFADLIAIHPKARHIFFIQVKPKKFSENARRKLESKFSWLNDEFICQFVVNS